MSPPVTNCMMKTLLLILFSFCVCINSQCSEPLQLVATVDGRNCDAKLTTSGEISKKFYSNNQNCVWVVSFPAELSSSTLVVVSTNSFATEDCCGRKLILCSNLR